MSGITIEQFGDYFCELHGHAPYDWQCRLATQTVEGNWPGAIDLPTGSGKTACLDIAVFALACQASLPVEERNAPRRIFFCVNRRVIVDEAYQRAKRIAKALWEAENNKADDRSALRTVAAALRILAGATADHETPPLDALELRGGIYRDNRWARSATQPTIICTTLDQLGSRLLFRGYGVSQGAAPIQAALTAYDSLILLDEAHISRPFLQTLQQVQRYLDADKWAEQDTGMKPTVVVPMTATPPESVDDNNVIRLSEEDRENESLSNRLTASKPAELKQITDIAKAAASEVKDLLKLAKGEPQPLAIGIIVNRVATAKTIYQALQEEKASTKKSRFVQTETPVELVIGSMRPIDRDKQAERLRELIGPNRPDVTSQTSIVVATQCLEVGADYDFDVLITECASLDALRQRFGRLNRAGRKDEEGMAIDSGAVILANKKDVKTPEQLDTLDKKGDAHDPIYGNALSRTWLWLNDQATDDTIDFGVDAFDKVLKEQCENGRIPANLLAPSASMDAPVMLPAYVDFWCQTSPKPVPDPDVSLFIHGPQSAEPDVQVCWRADLIEGEDSNREHWCDIVAMLPPTSAECITLPISRLRRWLTDSTDKFRDDGDSDLLAGQARNSDGQKKQKDDDRNQNLKHAGVLWRGPKESNVIESVKDLRPGDTLVLPASVLEIELLGHLPPTECKSPGDSSSFDCRDVGEIAFTRARDRAALRLHPSLRSRLPSGKAMDGLFLAAADRDTSPTIPKWRELLKAAATDLADSDQADLKTSLQALADPKNLRVDRYPGNGGVILTTRKRLKAATDWYIPRLDDGDDDASTTQRENPVLLDAHTQHVVQHLMAVIDLLPVSAQRDAFEQAAELHDLGKADERFQAMLNNASRTDAWLLTSYERSLLAKSGGNPRTLAQYVAACKRSGLPKGFRHEMLSVQLAAQSDSLPEERSDRDLLLHLIAAHHGHARPFAPVVIDEELPSIKVGGIFLSHDQRNSLLPPHRIDSGLAERFWKLTRRYGWWGLAYLESTLRLADQQASAAEDAGKYEDESINAQETVEATI